MDKQEMIADVFEAKEKLKEWGPVYADFRKIMSKKDADDAIQYVIKLQEEIDEESGH